MATQKQVMLNEALQVFLFAHGLGVTQIFYGLNHGVWFVPTTPIVVLYLLGAWAYSYLGPSMDERRRATDPNWRLYLTPNGNLLIDIIPLLFDYITGFGMVGFLFAVGWIDPPYSMAIKLSKTTYSSNSTLFYSQKPVKTEEINIIYGIFIIYFLTFALGCISRGIQNSRRFLSNVYEHPKVDLCKEVIGIFTSFLFIWILLQLLEHINKLKKMKLIF